MRLIIGVLVDRLLGDPQNWYHPVRTIGAWIRWWEKVLRRLLSADRGGGASGGRTAVRGHSSLFRGSAGPAFAAGP